MPLWTGPLSPLRGAWEAMVAYLRVMGGRLTEEQLIQRAFESPRNSPRVTEGRRLSAANILSPRYGPSSPYRQCCHVS